MGCFEKISKRRSLFVFVGLCCRTGRPVALLLITGENPKCKNATGAFPRSHRLRERGPGKRKPIGFANILANRFRADSTKTARFDIENATNVRYET